jgi:hypothetical protein
LQNHQYRPHDHHGQGKKEGGRMKGNEPAFPVFDAARTNSDGTLCTDYGRSDSGMTLRDWFAGMYLTGNFPNGAINKAKAAEEAYAVADAMLAAREEDKNAVKTA